MTKKPSKKFNRMCEIYRHFSSEWKDSCDYSDDAKMQLFLYESYGQGNCGDENGFALGKKWMDIMVKMWRQDLESGMLFIHELYTDKNYPKWWLNKVVGNYAREFIGEYLSGNEHPIRHGGIWRGRNR